MRTFHPSSCLTFLNTGAPFKRRWLFTIALANGQTVKYTDSDANVIDGTLGTFLCQGPIIEKTNVTHKLGLEVDSMTMTITPKSTDTVGGTKWFDIIRSGALDYATVEINCAIFDTSNAYKGYFNWFYGYVSDVPQLDGISAQINVKSQLSRLQDMQMPRNLVQPQCLNVLFDKGCGLSRASFTQTGTITAINGDGSYKISVSQADGYFDLGRLNITSGANLGVSKQIKHNHGQDLYLYAPLYFTPTVGDTIAVMPGCDLSQATCVGKFSNGNNFRGMRFVPVPETLA